MKFTVGLQFENDAFIDKIIAERESISECYFSWGDFPNGRRSQLDSENFTPWEMQRREENVLAKVSASGIGLNLLFNATCYGRDSLSRAFFEKIGMTVDYIRSLYGLSSVTTTSPLVARFVKENFKEIETRASVNMEIGTVEGMEYLSGYFDSFYVRRELNRDFGAIGRLREYAEAHGKQLHMLANSGCLNFCSAHNFHDNLVAHESEISAMSNYYEFKGLCREYLSDERNYADLYNHMSFVRPEDISLYEPYFASVKLATRIHAHPEAVLGAYLRGKYSGDLLALLEPAHSIYPYVLENGAPPTIRRIDGQ